MLRFIPSQNNPNTHQRIWCGQVERNNERLIGEITGSVFRTEPREILLSSHQLRQIADAIDRIKTERDGVK